MSSVSRTAWTLIIGGLAPILDSTIVAIALRDLAADLHASVGEIQWVSTAYLLALAVAVPLVGWAQQRFGGKRLWLFALTLFMAGSVLCAFAWSAHSLIAFRVVQGLGGGLMLPLMQSLVVQAAGGRSLGRVVAMVSLPISLGPILGPILGGVILHSLSWPWLFLVNVPLCVAGLVTAALVLPDDRATRTRTRLDVTGLLLLAPALAGVLLGLSNVAKGGFGRPDVLVPLITGVILLGAFIGYALRLGDRAVINLRLLAGRPLASSTSVFAFTGAVLYGAMLLLPLYLQESRGLSVLNAALFLIPQGVGSLALRTQAGKLTDLIGARWVAAAGFAVIAAGTLPFAFADADTSSLWLMIVLFVRGLGLGAVLIPVMTVAYLGLDRDRIPQASMITRIAQQVGGSFGTAILAVVLQAGTFPAAFWVATGVSVLAIGLSFLLPTAAPAPARALQPAS
ncbi:DHA2 family efflux MFS transporter permease subunit [Actinoplanes sp. NPDC026623]|uniref:DHA2 family efflux MFS transporter permease subunit n=1 Tax=Actinoplanes sp. NPDC026623 TaxID=3155610 RepID=UPI0033D3C11F